MFVENLTNMFKKATNSFRFRVSLILLLSLYSINHSVAQDAGAEWVIKPVLTGLDEFSYNDEYGDKVIFTLNGKNVLGIGGFKNYFTIWFFNGVFLKDEKNVLVNSQEGLTKSLRQWRFSSVLRRRCQHRCLRSLPCLIQRVFFFHDVDHLSNIIDIIIGV